MTSHQGQNEKSRRGAQGPPVHQIWCNSDHYFRSYGILKKMAHAIFFRSAAILKVLVRPNWVSNLSEPWVKESDWGYFSSVIVVSSQHKLAHSCQGRGQRSNGAINRNKHFFRSSLPVSLPFVNAIIASDPRVARATTTMAVLRICAVSSPFWLPGSISLLSSRNMY